MWLLFCKEKFICKINGLFTHFTKSIFPDLTYMHAILTRNLNFCSSVSIVSLKFARYYKFYYGLERCSFTTPNHHDERARFCGISGVYKRLIVHSQLIRQTVSLPITIHRIGSTGKTMRSIFELEDSLLLGGHAPLLFLFRFKESSSFPDCFRLCHPRKPSDVFLVEASRFWDRSDKYVKLEKNRIHFYVW